MSTRKVVDAKNLDTDELVYFKSHAKATYMSDGTTVEDKLANVNTDTYAGGTAVTLNGTSKAGKTASFYAPTYIGTEGYVLTSTGSSPVWRHFKPILYESTSPEAVYNGSVSANNSNLKYFVTETDTIVTVQLSLYNSPNPEIMFKIVNVSTSDKTLHIVPDEDYGTDTIHIINHTTMAPGKCYLVSVLANNAIMIETGETDNRKLNKITISQSSSDNDDGSSATVTVTITAQYAVTRDLYFNIRYDEPGAEYPSIYSMTLQNGSETVTENISNVASGGSFNVTFTTRADDNYIYYS